jgi:hypothetical protein
MDSPGYALMRGITLAAGMLDEMEEVETQDDADEAPTAEEEEEAETNALPPLEDKEVF